MKKHSILMILVMPVIAVLALGCNPPFSTAPVDGARGTPFSVEVLWRVGGTASNRGIIDDPLVASVSIEVLGTGGDGIGSGSLMKAAGHWRGIIHVSQVGLATFLASAKDTGGVELYYGERRQTLSGEKDMVTVTVSRQVRGIVTTFAGMAGQYGSADGGGSAARFWYPEAVTTDGTNLYVADCYNCTIRKIVIATRAVTTLAGTANSGGGTDGTGSAARFYQPYGITTAGANLYVADSWNHTIRKIVIATAEVTTLAGAAGQSGSADGTGGAARFTFPYGITTDGAILYVADTGNGTIRKIVIATGEVTTLAGVAGSNGSDDGTGSAARFYNPFGITNDGTNLYVADSNNHTIRKVVMATGEVTTLAGTALYADSTDGMGGAARFWYPEGITTDGTILYVTDNLNKTIRRIVISTRFVTTLAGTARAGGFTDGTGSAARFAGPVGITSDGINLYVTDEGGSTIRKIE